MFSKELYPQLLMNDTPVTRVINKLFSDIEQNLTEFELQYLPQNVISPHFSPYLWLTSPDHDYQSVFTKASQMYPKETFVHTITLVFNLMNSLDSNSAVNPHYIRMFFIYSLLMRSIDTHPSDHDVIYLLNQISLKAFQNTVPWNDGLLQSSFGLMLINAANKGCNIVPMLFDSMQGKSSLEILSFFMISSEYIICTSETLLSALPRLLTLLGSVPKKMKNQAGYDLHSIFRKFSELFPREHSKSLSHKIPSLFGIMREHVGFSEPSLWPLLSFALPYTLDESFSHDRERISLVSSFVNSFAGFENRKRNSMFTYPAALELVLAFQLSRDFTPLLREVVLAMAEGVRKYKVKNSSLSFFVLANNEEFDDMIKLANSNFSLYCSCVALIMRYGRIDNMKAISTPLMNTLLSSLTRVMNMGSSIDNKELDSVSKCLDCCLGVFRTPLGDRVYESECRFLLEGCSDLRKVSEIVRAALYFAKTYPERCPSSLFRLLWSFFSPGAIWDTRISQEPGAFAVLATDLMSSFTLILTNSLIDKTHTVTQILSITVSFSEFLLYYKTYVPASQVSIGMTDCAFFIESYGNGKFRAWADILRSIVKIIAPDYQFRPSKPVLSRLLNAPFAFLARGIESFDAFQSSFQAMATYSTLDTCKQFAEKVAKLLCTCGEDSVIIKSLEYAQDPIKEIMLEVIKGSLASKVQSIDFGSYSDFQSSVASMSLLLGSKKNNQICLLLVKFLAFGAFQSHYIGAMLRVSQFIQDHSGSPNEYGQEIVSHFVQLVYMLIKSSSLSLPAIDSALNALASLFTTFNFGGSQGQKYLMKARRSVVSILIVLDECAKVCTENDTNINCVTNALRSLIDSNYEICWDIFVGFGQKASMPMRYSLLVSLTPGKLCNSIQVTDSDNEDTTIQTPWFTTSFSQILRNPYITSVYFDALISFFSVINVHHKFMTYVLANGNETQRAQVLKSSLKFSTKDLNLDGLHAAFRERSLNHFTTLIMPNSELTHTLSYFPSYPRKVEIFCQYFVLPFLSEPIFYDVNQPASSSAAPFAASLSKLQLNIIGEGPLLYRPNIIEQLKKCIAFLGDEKLIVDETDDFGVSNNPMEFLIIRESGVIGDLHYTTSPRHFLLRPSRCPQNELPFLKDYVTVVLSGFQGGLVLVLDMSREIPSTVKELLASLPQQILNRIEKVIVANSSVATCKKLASGLKDTIKFEMYNKDMLLGLSASSLKSDSEDREGKSVLSIPVEVAGRDATLYFGSIRAAFSAKGVSDIVEVSYQLISKIRELEGGIISLTKSDGSEIARVTSDNPSAIRFAFETKIRYMEVLKESLSKSIPLSIFEPGRFIGRIANYLSDDAPEVRNSASSLLTTILLNEPTFKLVNLPVGFVLEDVHFLKPFTKSPYHLLKGVIFEMVSHFENEEKSKPFLGFIKNLINLVKDYDVAFSLAVDILGLVFTEKSGSYDNLWDLIDEPTVASAFMDCALSSPIEKANLISLMKSLKRKSPQHFSDLVGQRATLPKTGFDRLFSIISELFELDPTTDLCILVDCFVFSLSDIEKFHSILTGLSYSVSMVYDISTQLLNELSQVKKSHDYENLKRAFNFCDHLLIEIDDIVHTNYSKKFRGFYENPSNFLQLFFLSCFSDKYDHVFKTCLQSIVSSDAFPNYVLYALANIIEMIPSQAKEMSILSTRFFKLKSREMKNQAICLLTRCAYVSQYAFDGRSYDIVKLALESSSKPDLLAEVITFIRVVFNTQKLSREDYSIFLLPIIAFTQDDVESIMHFNSGVTLSLTDLIMHDSVRDFSAQFLAKCFLSGFAHRQAPRILNLLTLIGKTFPEALHSCKLDLLDSLKTRLIKESNMSICQQFGVFHSVLMKEVTELRKMDQEDEATDEETIIEIKQSCKEILCFY